MSTTNDGEDPQKKNTKQGILGTVKRKVVGASSLSSSSHGSTLFWIAFGLFGWYFPRSLILRKTTTASILSLTPPYQEVGDKILLDFELNQPHVDPPTVDSTFPFYFAEFRSNNFALFVDFRPTNVYYLSLSFLFLQISCFGVQPSFFPLSFMCFMHGTPTTRAACRMHQN